MEAQTTGVKAPLNKDLKGYELHITFKGDDYKTLVESEGWKFSKIDGDPVLGPGVKCYASKWIPMGNGLGQAMNFLTTYVGIFAKRGMPIERYKLELVIYDSNWEKTKANY